MGRISAKGRFEPFRRSKESVANSNMPNPGKEFFRRPISRHRTSFCLAFLTYVGLGAGRAASASAIDCRSPSLNSAVISFIGSATRVFPRNI